MIGLILAGGGILLVARGITGGTAAAIFTGTLLIAMGLLTSLLESAL